MNDGLRYFGYPLTEELQGSFADNITRTVQYFERVRLEVHPEANGGPGTIAIGSLGRDPDQRALLQHSALLRQRCRPHLF